MTDGLTREQQASIALHDFASRDGATTARVMKQMKAAGFSAAEIAKAANGDPA